MERVLIIGSPGAGKSTLAIELARRTGLPLIHLDQEYWRPGWIEPDKSQWQHRVASLIAGDRWIMDGNFGGTLGARLTRADTVIDHEFPAWLCVMRVLKRVAASWGRVRTDMADGCPEHFDARFLLFAATFPFSARKRIKTRLRGFTRTVIRLRNPAEARRFLASFDPRG